MSAALLVCALLGVAGVVWQANEARAQARVAHEQARIAKLEAGKAQATKDFLLDIFNANSERHPDGARARQTTAEELLAIASEKIEASQQRDPELHSELLGTLGTLNFKIDRPAEAEALFKARIDLVKQQFGPRDLRIVDAYINMADMMLVRGRYDEARDTALEARAALDAHGVKVSTERGRVEHMLGYAAYLSISNKDDPTAQHHFAEEVRILEQLPPGKDLVLALLGLGKTYMSAGKVDTGLPLFQRAIEVATKALGPMDVTLATAHQGMTGELIRLRRLDEAETHLDAALRIVVHAHGPESIRASSAYMDRGRLKLQQGQYLGAIPAFEQSLAIRQKTYGGGDIWVGLARSGLADALFNSGDFARAEAVLAECFSQLKAGRADHVRILAFRTRAGLRVEQGRTDDALADVVTGLALVDAAGNTRTPGAAQYHVIRAEALARQGRFDQARASLDMAVDILKGDASDAAYPAVAALNLAESGLALARGSVSDAQRRAEELLGALRARADRDSLWTLEDGALRRLADAQRRNGKPAEACVSLDAAIALRATRALPTDPRLTEARARRAHCT